MKKEKNPTANISIHALYSIKVINKTFTLKSPKNTNFKTIITHCVVCLPYDGSLEKSTKPDHHSYNGLWDTGATNTVITQKVVDDLGLKPVGKVKTYHADGSSIVDQYIVNVILPNTIGFSFLTVTVGKLSGFDILIGMDIIGCGEFSIRHEDGCSIFEFSMQSPENEQKNILNTKPISSPPQPQFSKVGRNNQCPCGSGKKYKHCHGIGA